jgi:ribonuclease E
MNIAASKEIINQIKLKNISGIIVIDFIDMSHQDDQLALLEYLNTQLQSNFSGSQIIQISEIGLVEITKQREGRNIYDMFANHCLVCNGIGKIREEKLSNKISRYLLEFTYLHG